MGDRHLPPPLKSRCMQYENILPVLKNDKPNTASRIIKQDFEKIELLIGKPLLMSEKYLSVTSEKKGPVWWIEHHRHQNPSVVISIRFALFMTVDPSLNRSLSSKFW